MVCCAPHTPLMSYRALLRRYRARREARKLLRKLIESKYARRGTGIGTIIAIAILVFIVVFAVLYFGGYLQGLVFGVTGTPQYAVSVSALSTSQFSVNIKNIGQVAIEKVDVKIVDSNTRNVIWQVSVDLSKTPVKQGQELSISCIVGFGCYATISGYSGQIKLKATWPPNELIAGKRYIVAIQLTFANGETKPWSMPITATS